MEVPGVRFVKALVSAVRPVAPVPRFENEPPLILNSYRVLEPLLVIEAEIVAEEPTQMVVLEANVMVGGGITVIVIPLE